MEFSLQKLPKSEVEIQIILPFPEFEPHIKKAAVLISEETNIEGFRKGKAPYDIVKNKFGENAIYERAAELAVHSTYSKVVSQLTVNDQQPAIPFVPVGRPEITVTKLAPGNELKYKVKLALLPEVKLPEYKVIAKLIKKESKKVLVTEEEVAGAIEWVCESRATLVAIDRPAQKGDRLEIDFEIRHGGVKIADGESRNHPVIIGKSKFIPGFEDQLLGMKIGEEKSFTLTAPKDWHEKSLAGKALDFKVTVKLVQERQIPDLSDAFVKNLGEFKSVDEFKTSVKQGLLDEKKEKERQRVRAVIIETVAKEVSLEIPEVLVSAEVEKMLQELKSGVEQMGMKWEDYLMHIKKSVEDLIKEWRDEAKKRVRIALCLREISLEEKIEPDEREIEERANQFLSQFKTAEDLKKVDLGELKEYSRGILRNEKVFEFLENL